MATKRKIVGVSDAEDVAINRAAASDPDTPELSDEQLARMRPARDVLPQILGPANAAALLKKRGRPSIPESQRKVALNVRYDRDLVEAFKATGDGWQTRMNDALRDYAKSHRMLPN